MASSNERGKLETKAYKVTPKQKLASHLDLAETFYRRFVLHVLRCKYFRPNMVRIDDFFCMLLR